LMIYGVKRTGQIKERKSAVVTFIYTDDHIVMDFDEGSLRGVKLTIGRLNRREKTISVSVQSDYGINDRFKEL